MNIYQMYHANNNKFGFYVIRGTWGNTVAKVMSINGVVEGEKIKGKHPYYGNPEVTAEFYKVKDARYIPNPTQYCTPENKESQGPLSVPGTYGYDMIGLV